ncbi:MAG: hypothetical protein CL608_03785 [Anaerolineaceae bacterium]|nr:hypothetical protein [Anaerolineaceae bacterium]
MQLRTAVYYWRQFRKDMYWPDYTPRKKKNTCWRGIGILLILLTSFLLAGEINGWWQIVDSANSLQKEPAAEVVEQDILAEEKGAATAVPIRPTKVSPSSLSAAAQAPDFTLPDLNDSTQMHTLSGYAGKPVILNFWASWCVPCREEMPALQRIYEQHSPDGLVVLGINQTFVDDLETARAFVADLGLTFPNARDDEDEVSSSLYGIMGLPTSVFVSANGEIAHVQVGQLTDEQIERYSARLVAGGKIVP